LVTQGPAPAGQLVGAGGIPRTAGLTHLLRQSSHLGPEIVASTDGSPGRSVELEEAVDLGRIHTPTPERHFYPINVFPYLPDIDHDDITVA
jgi:hypothetical protein